MHDGNNRKTDAPNGGTRKTATPAHHRLTEVTAKEVQSWFRLAWPRAAKHPNEIECYTVAVYVNTIVHRENAKYIRKSSKELKEEYDALLKHGRGFIRYSRKVLEDLRQKANNLNRDWGPEVDGLDSEWASENDLTKKYKRWRAEHLALIATIEAATGEVETVLKNCKTPTAWKSRDPMRWIADATTGAWERLGGKPPALGKYSVSPLVAFVQLALQGIGFTGKGGQPYSDETISDHLNERIGGGGARRRHSGAKRSTKHP
jgi:hypothetical protein